MDYFSVEFAMHGQGRPDDEGGRDDDARRPARVINAILRQAGDMLVLKKFPEAIDILEEAVEANPSSMSLLQMLTTAYIDSKRIPDAKRELDRLHQRGVKEPMLSIRLATVTLGKRRFDDAIFYFREALALGAEPGEWSILLGNALMRTGQLSEAEEVYQDVLPISDKARYDLFLGLSAIRMQQERYGDSADLALHALKANKPKTRAIYFLGLAFMRMGDSRKAVDAFRHFARMQPNKVAPYRWLERLTRETGDDEEADAFNLKARDLLENRREKRMKKMRQTSQ